MVDLIAKSPVEGLVPAEVGTVRLEDVTPDQMTSVAPFKGKVKAASEVLKGEMGNPTPAPLRSTGKDGARLIWFGQNLTMVLGALDGAKLAGIAAVTDQSDGWVVLRLEGADAEGTLARLTPLDLRLSVFKRGHTARSELQHMMASITRTGANSFDIMVMRSMARTAVHDLTEAAKRVAASAGAV